VEETVFRLPAGEHEDFFCGGGPIFPWGRTKWAVEVASNNGRGNDRSEKLRGKNPRYGLLARPRDLNGRSL